MNAPVQPDDVIATSPAPSAPTGDFTGAQTGTPTGTHAGTHAGRHMATHTGRRRPLGLSAGAGVLVGAWFVAGAIARLTGAPSVIAIMAALLVTFGVDALTGWASVGRLRPRRAIGPSTTDAGADSRVAITLDRPTNVRRHPRLVISDRDVAIGSLDLTADALGRHEAGRTGSTADASAGSPSTAEVTTDVSFEQAGIVRELRIDVEAVGAFGLLWWRRSTSVTVEPIEVAPPAGGRRLDVEYDTTVLDGAVPAARGNHLGDVDGVRPWREGEAAGAVHWPSSLRAGSLIVHDRASSSEQRWTLDLDRLATIADRSPDRAPDRAPDSTTDSAGRVRATLDEGLRRGHTVAVSIDGEQHFVANDRDAAHWAAVVAARAERPQRTRTPLLQRSIALRRASVEQRTGIDRAARWAAAGAAFCALAMLVGALAWSTGLIAVLGGAIALGAYVSLRVARRAAGRPLALQIAIVVAILAAIGAVVLDARDVDGLVAALRGPMPNLLMLLVALHGFEVVDRRTLRVHQAIGFVVAAYAAGLRIDDALGWWLGAWGIAFLVSLWLTPGTGTRGQRARSTRRAARPRVVLAPIGWTAGAIIATLALLAIVPIPDGPARLGLPAVTQDAPTAPTPGALVGPDGNTPAAASGGDRGAIGDTVGYPGFTDTLDTSIRGDLGDEVVMRVRSPEPAFWRGQTFADFDGRVWRASPLEGERQDGPTITIEPTLGYPTRSSVPTEELIQTYFVETDLPNIVFAAPRPSTVIFDGALWSRPDGALRSDVTLTKGSIYTVVSDRVQVTPDSLRAQGDIAEVFAEFRDVAGAEQIEPFLELPESTSQRTVDLATDLRTPGESTYDTILAYEAWLAANTEYDLDAPVPDDGADAVDDFLFESQLGYCEQIASTLAIMLRSQGVPARLATGYVTGERDRVSGVWKVLARDAHAWVEVWFPETGWQPFDPTASVPLAGEAGTATVGGDLARAAIATVASHRAALAIGVLAAVSAWAAASALRARRRRRARGRWGLLQDRFTALAPALLDTADPDRAPPSSAPGSIPATGATAAATSATGVAGATGVAAATNPAIAIGLLDRDRPTAPLSAAAVAEILDRAAFDPTWVDDDDLYRRTSDTIGVLERSPS